MVNQSIKTSPKEKIKYQNNIMNKYEPTITMKLFKESTSHKDSLMRYDHENCVIYILTLNGNNNHNDSTLYYSLSLGTEFNIIELFYENEKFIFSKIEVGPGVIVGYSDSQQLFAISENLGKNWRIIERRMRLIKIEINSNNPKDIAVVNEDGSIKLGIQNCHIYFFPQVYMSIFFLEYHFTHHFLLYKTNNIQPKKILSIRNILKFDISGNILWIVNEIEHVRKLHFIIEKDSVTEAIFPIYLKPINFFVFNSISDIFVIVLNETRNIFLYSASTLDYKFTRIGELISNYNEKTIESCYDVETFEKLPGLLMINLETYVKGMKIIFTAISFNHGLKWTHIKAPNRVENLTCEWPSCYLQLKLECPKDYKTKSIKTNEHSLSTMIAYGTIYKGIKEIYSGIFVSVDAGYTWELSPKLINNIVMIDSGGIFIGLPKSLHAIYYSLNFGRIWKSVEISKNSLIPMEVYYDTIKASLAATIIAVDDINQKWYFLKIDFTNVIKNKCTKDDYEEYTIGVHKKAECFQGKKGITYRRRHDIVCRNIIHELPKIEPINCPCTSDDFGCTFGAFKVNEKCYWDPDVDIEKQMTYVCRQGEFILRPSLVKKLSDDVCELNNRWVNQKTDICEFTEEHNSISILVGSKIKYTTVDDTYELKFVDIPIALRNHGFIKAYGINFIKRCLYLLNETGIIQICYNAPELIIQPTVKIFLHDPTVLGILVDKITKSIFYYNKTIISIINENSQHRKTLYKSVDQIIFSTLFSSQGTIACVYRVSGRANKIYCLHIISLKGEEKMTLCYDNPILFVLYDNRKSAYSIYLESISYTVNERGIASEQKNYQYKNLLQAIHRKGTEYLIINNGIVLGDSVYNYNNIHYGQFHLASETVKEEINACKLAHCDMFCFPLNSDKYECNCPDNMNYDKTKNKCICDSQHPTCSKCKSHEFHCKNSECIHIKGRCNGVDNCGDNSDEYDCSLVCEIDDMLCDNNTKCVSYFNICDGTNNCQDGMDEMNCHATIKCEKTQYSCFNGKCIPKEKYCDGKNDCHDFSDEDSCETECKYFESKCDNGQCVLRSQVCDNIFHCSDLSDERGCDIILSEFINTSCSIICDSNKCIPREKLCNHITDCFDGSDETRCISQAFTAMLQTAPPAFFYISDYSIACSNPGQGQCISEFMCYERERICDNFFDCSDHSDELGCPERDLCEFSEIYRCKSNEKCITINQHCDGINDCDDTSDEGTECISEIYIKYIKIKVTNEFPEFHWEVNVPLDKNIDDQKIRKNIITRKKSVSILDLDICKKYILIVKIRGLNVGRFLHFTHKPLSLPPLHLSYNHQKQLIYLVLQIPSCFPQNYYIECRNSDRIVFQNFSFNSLFFVKADQGLTCRVSLCPMNVFNISCSTFSSPIYLKSPSSIYLIKLFLIPILSIIIIFTVICLRKRNRGSYFIRSYYNLSRADTISELGAIFNSKRNNLIIKEDKYKKWIEILD
ncbi:hypothetical protein HZS_2254 [Henneguya salminicola]|nr:hypothetical protein HZS_2254 [Henneguya salminicola]